jgi:prepilin-type N-terminal cleavage/methylation domain-containing protein
MLLDRPPSAIGPTARPAGVGASRAGFTLIEVMVALLLTSMVALLAYASAYLSLETRARLDTDLGRAQSARVLREVLQDALRNARSPQRRGDTTFGLSRGRLTFLAAGAGPPFDPEYDWRISVETDADGLELIGAPVGRAPAARVVLRAPGVTRCDVQVLAPGGSQWVSEWPATTVMPRAIVVTLMHDDAPVGPPLEVTLTPRYTSAAVEGEDGIE